MAHKYNISDEGLELIKAYEGFRPVETVLVSGQKVIGYGHPYLLGEASLLTQKKAEDILKVDLKPIEKAINYSVHAPLSQGQFDALASLAFNIGIDAFSESSVLHHLNNGQPLAAAAGFDEWRKSIVAEKTYIIDALVRRRTAEKALFLKPETGIVSAPRYEVPAMHDDTVMSGEEDIEVFSGSDVEGFVEQAPYEETPIQEVPIQETPIQEKADKDFAPAALLLSEQVADPKIYADVADEVPEADIAPDEDIAEDCTNNIDGNEGTEKTIIETDIEHEDAPAEEVAVQENPEQENAETEEELSPIAIAAADVSERLDNLMDEQEEEVEQRVETAELVANNDAAPVESALQETQDIVEETEEAAPTAEPEIEIVEPDTFVAETANQETTYQETTIQEAIHQETEEINDLEAEAEAEAEAETKSGAFSQRKAKKKKLKGTGAFWTALIVGLSLIGGSLWKMKFSPATNLGEIGAFLAPIVLLVGAMMIMGGMLFMVKAQLREQAG